MVCGGLSYSHTRKIPLGAKTIKKNTNSTQNKSETHRAKQYEVTSFLSTDCGLSTETCSKNVYSLAPDEASVRKIKKKHCGKGIWRPRMECIMQNSVRLEIRSVKWRENFRNSLRWNWQLRLNPTLLPNAIYIWKYINFKTKTRVGVSELNTDPADPSSKLTTSDIEKAEVLEQNMRLWKQLKKTQFFLGHFEILKKVQLFRFLL